MRLPGSFALTKWYVDAVDARGHALIGYWAHLSWRGLEVAWQSIASYAGGRRARVFSLRNSPAPRRDGDRHEWTSPPLRSRYEITAGGAAFAEFLWPPGGDASTPTRVDWSCEVPVGRVRATLPDGSAFSGVGYAERITMTVPPWRLPIRELQWGRWCDDGGTRSVVWIEWSGDGRRWVYLDGVRSEAAVSKEAIAGPAFELALTPTNTLEQRALADVFRGAPLIAGLLPESMRGVRETRWLSRGVLRRANEPPVAGMAIHEMVVFP